jgi:hypothetical protein
VTAGQYVIPCRLLLTQEQRDRLERLLRKRGAELPDVLSEIVAQYLDELDEAELAEPLARLDDRQVLEERLKSYRRDLRRLRLRQSQLAEAAPAWFAGYIADVEGEIAALERRLRETSS